MTKPVTLSNEAYNALLKVKGKEMSFSDAVMKLVGEIAQKKDFKKFAGSMKSSSETLEKLKSQIAADRERNTERL